MSEISDDLQVAGDQVLVELGEAIEQLSGVISELDAVDQPLARTAATIVGRMRRGQREAIRLNGLAANHDRVY